MRHAEPIAISIRPATRYSMIWIQTKSKSVWRYSCSERCHLHDEAVERIRAFVLLSTVMLGICIWQAAGMIAARIEHSRKAR